MTITVPGIVVSDAAILAAARIAEEDPELTIENLGADTDVTLDEARPVFAAAAPYLIRDWVIAVLDQHPHITPHQLRETADGLLPEERT